MKKNAIWLAAALVLAGLCPTVVLAADGGTYHSDGTVEFLPSEDPTDPVNPTDPKEPVEPSDPHEPGTAGPLSIDFASNLNFGKQKITSKNETYLVAAQAFKKLDDEGKPTGDTLYGPNYVQVTDNRGKETGWTLTVTQGAQFKSTAQHDLDGAEITLKNAQVVTASNSPSPSSATGDVKLVPGVAATVMAAADKQGAGTYLNDWGTAANLKDVTENSETIKKNNSIELAVPGSTTKYAEKYSTQLTWTLSDVPGNSEAH